MPVNFYGKGSSICGLLFELSKAAAGERYLQDMGLNNFKITAERAHKDY